MSSPSITQVIAVLILQVNGDRLAVRYYKQHGNVDPQTDVYSTSLSKQKHLESQLLKAAKILGQVSCLIVDSLPVAYYVASDFAVYVVGTPSQNEILLGDYCDSVKKALIGIAGEELNRNVLYEKLDTVFLLLDDMVDGGIIMEKDHNTLLKRLACRTLDTTEALPLNQAIYKVRNNVIRTLLNST